MWDLNYFKLLPSPRARAVPRAAARGRPANARRAPARSRHGLLHSIATSRSRNIPASRTASRGSWTTGADAAAQRSTYIASLLYDGKADLPTRARSPADDAASTRSRPGPAAARALLNFLPRLRAHCASCTQAMGAYGYRGFFELKPRFLESVPHQARNIVLLAKGLPIEAPEIERAFPSHRRRGGPGVGTDRSARKGLRVHVASFRLPRRRACRRLGNGGGFAFDCRSLSNPRPAARTLRPHRHRPAIARFLRGAARDRALLAPH